jgi:SAGA-associated factor 29
LDALYREQVKIAEAQKAFLAEHKGLLDEKIGVLLGVVRHNEEAAEAPAPAGRASNSRSSAMDFDGPSDSPAPSSAENRHVRKVGTGRTSSQPPRGSDSIRGDATPSEAVERSVSKPKVVFSMGEEVAFKRKIPGKTEEQDWIQGIVTRVIGEGKSRRYDVQDPFPDEAASKPGEFTYKSSASQMVPIPPIGTPLGDYEIGKHVLALYPDTTTFYRAEVKAMLDDGANVQLLFEDEAAGALKIVERRMVLDHKG